MIDLYEEYFDEPELANHTLGNIGTVAMQPNSDPEEWVFVRARSMTRDAGLFSEGIYRVLRTQSAKPLTTGTEVLDNEDEVLDRMPQGPRTRRAVPSIEGEYLTIKEVGPDEQDDGKVFPRTTGSTTVIPVEFVIEPLSYDEVVSELISQTL